MQHNHEPIPMRKKPQKENEENYQGRQQKSKRNKKSPAYHKRNQ